MTKTLADEILNGCGKDLHNDYPKGKTLCGKECHGCTKIHYCPQCISKAQGALEAIKEIKLLLKDSIRDNEPCCKFNIEEE